MWRFAAGALSLRVGMGKQMSKRLSAYAKRLGHEAVDMDNYAYTYKRRLAPCDATICDDEIRFIAASVGYGRATARSITTFTIC
ncbi:hypothetical protein BDU57DRAFT_29017 [Ampelomyces quisqualis]|uniref:Uncharacterized protein n=1 Tax=Ampelomyces quisqualis TaxID=50730 RepID=A0A6A5R1A1_AMPQU|nr:hypothetical protein BDU57DRAFT_29017 [Ampelomyces quisqualis]